MWEMQAYEVIISSFISTVTSFFECTGDVSGKPKAPKVFHAKFQIQVFMRTLRYCLFYFVYSILPVVVLLVRPIALPQKLKTITG